VKQSRTTSKREGEAKLHDPFELFLWTRGGMNPASERVKQNGTTAKRVDEAKLHGLQAGG
jgi:hypothetical protein